MTAEYFLPGIKASYGWGYDRTELNILSLMNFWTARWVSWKNSSMQSVPHFQNPEARLARVFRRVAANGMADMPIGNPALDVEAVGFRRTKNGHWLGVLITPWAVNLMLLPAIDACAPWPETPAGGTQIWRFPSGAYEFIVAPDRELGVYHFCSIFSPPSSFVSQEAARQTAHALLSGLFMPFPPDAPAPGKDAPGKHRRALLGLP